MSESTAAYQKAFRSLHPEGKKFLMEHTENSSPVHLMSDVCQLTKILHEGVNANGSTMRSDELGAQLALAGIHLDEALRIWLEVCKDYDEKQTKNN